MEFGRQAEDESPNPPPTFQDSVFTKPLPSYSSSSRVVGVGVGVGVGARGGESTVHSHPLHPTASAAGGGDDGVGASGASRAAAAAVPAAEAAVRYHECLRNHAASLGGHVVDGCCEFMPATAADPLKCAACGCHRSFHRKDLPASGGGGSPYYHQPNGRVPLLLPPPPPNRHRHHFSPAFPPSPPTGAMAFTSGSGGTTTESSSEERNAAAHAAFASPSGASKKRFRTKFTAEQKEKMLAFAQRANWRIQRQDDAATERFCAEIGVSRHVLKVWMHNNKHSLKRQQQQQEQQQEQQQQHQQQILQPSSPI